MKIDRVLLAAPKSGSGKTVIVCGLLAALKRREMKVTAFKCGPDFIDPMFHRKALGIPSWNLDSFFLQEKALKELFIKRAAGSELAVIEGVMGYYDGLGGTSLKASAYEIACMTETPVILIVDARGASLSLAAEIKGFMEYVPSSRIAGVIFNRMNGMLCEKLKPCVEALGVKMLGCVPEEEVFHLESRHLGLDVLDGAKEQLEAIGRRLEETVDVDGILQLAAAASEQRPLAEGPAENNVCKKTVIGVAMDEAFCFYYEENLRLMENLGARLVYFSPLHDRTLPEGLDGMLLGGGYPELWAKMLSKNTSMRTAVAEALRGGMPVLAECGGFLYLHRSLEGLDGQTYPMAGAVEYSAFRKERLSRFGYAEFTTEEGERIRGHEFHYWESENPGSLWTAGKPEAVRSWECMHGLNGGYCGFPHLYYPSNPGWLKRWLERCRVFGEMR